MCNLVSFHHNPATGEVAVRNLVSHSETEKALGLDLNRWREGHYLPDGAIDARVAPGDRITAEECAERIRARWPSFLDFFRWAVREGGADLNARDNNGVTLTHWTTAHGCADGLKLLIEEGIDINARSSDGGWTPAHCAITFNRVSCLALLIEVGADLEAQLNTGLTPAKWAKACGRTDCLALIKKAERREAMCLGKRRSIL